MKHIFVIALFAFCSLSLTAQVEENSQYIEIGDTKKKKSEIETFTNGRSHHGFALGMVFRYGDIDGKGAFLSSFKASYIMNHYFELGFEGTGIYSRTELANGNKVTLTGGYGGLYMNPIIAPLKKVHVAFPTTIGVGAFGYDEYDFPFEPDFNEWDAIFVAEPGVQLEFNIATFFRIELVGKYRFTSKLQLNDVPIKNLNGFSGGIGFKFGRF